MCDGTLGNRHDVLSPALGSAHCCPRTFRLRKRRSRGHSRSGIAPSANSQFIRALTLLYQDAATVPYPTRALNYEHAMSELR